MEHISLAPEVLGYFAGFPITNTILVTWTVGIVLIMTSLFVYRRVTLVPTSYLQNTLELVVENVENLSTGLAQSRGAAFLPIILTFFFFIIISNWFGLLPGFGTIGLERFVEGKKVFVPLFRSINSDLNTTLALALVSLVATHYFSIKYLGIGGYLKRWFSLNPILLFVGVLELFSEFTKTVSLSFRLFGNIFAGEAVLLTISNLFAFVLPLPFYFLEIIVGFVQAAVFMMLTLVFMVLLTEKHNGH